MYTKHRYGIRENQKRKKEKGKRKKEKRKKKGEKPINKIKKRKNYYKQPTTNNKAQQQTSLHTNIISCVQ